MRIEDDFKHFFAVAASICTQNNKTQDKWNDIIKFAGLTVHHQCRLMFLFNLHHIVHCQTPRYFSLHLASTTLLDSPKQQTQIPQEKEIQMVQHTNFCKTKLLVSVVLAFYVQGIWQIDQLLWFLLNFVEGEFKYFINCIGYTSIDILNKTLE